MNNKYSDKLYVIEYPSLATNGWAGIYKPYTNEILHSTDKKEMENKLKELVKYNPNIPYRLSMFSRKNVCK
jgi:hypothetical protein